MKDTIMTIVEGYDQYAKTIVIKNPQYIPRIGEKIDMVDNMGDAMMGTMKTEVVNVIYKYSQNESEDRINIITERY